jgi:DNA-binding transcriptional LysR family regulator
MTTLPLAELKTFVVVAEQQSFTTAAAVLSMTKSRASNDVRRLEQHLGTTLLHRTTRSVGLTADGELLLVRARELLALADDVEGQFVRTAPVRGVVRIDLPLGLARSAVLPRLAELHRAHPQLQLQISTTDRFVDPVREGFDVVLRVGIPPDSSLVAVRLGTVALINVASPAYLQAYGVPRSVSDLEHHLLVHYTTALGTDVPDFEWVDGSVVRHVRMRSVISVNNTDAYRLATLAGLGIAQLPRTGVAQQLADGELLEVLPEATCAPLPVSLLHTHQRRVPRRVRIVLDWLHTTLLPHVALWHAPATAL